MGLSRVFVALHELFLTSFYMERTQVHSTRKYSSCGLGVSSIKSIMIYPRGGMVFSGNINAIGKLNNQRGKVQGRNFPRGNGRKLFWINYKPVTNTPNTNDTRV